MIELLIGFFITIISLCIGYSLGKHQSVAPPNIQKKINQILQRAIVNPEVGGIERPSAQDNYYRDNPKWAEEQRIMEKEFEELGKK